MAGKQGVGIDLDVINKIANQVKKIHDLGVETGIVVGGGNFWRGRDAQTIERFSIARCFGKIRCKHKMSNCN